MWRAAPKLLLLLVVLAVLGLARDASAQVGEPGSSTGGVVVTRSPEDGSPAPAVAASPSAATLGLASLRVWWAEVSAGWTRPAERSALRARRTTLRQGAARIR